MTFERGFEGEKKLKANLKTILTFVVAIAGASAIIGAQSCNLNKGESYGVLSVNDLTALVDGLPEPQKRSLAQNDSQRKGFITQVKQMYSLAQAAQAEGLDKTPEFKNQFQILSDRILVNEYMKKNPDEKYSEDEGKTYVAAHLKDFETDLKAITEGAPEQPTAEQVELLKGQWAEMKVRAEKAKKSGLEKDPAVQMQMRFQRANRLATAYSAFLEKKLKPTPEEVKKYLSEHPEADMEKIKAKADAVLQKVKKGENFEDLARENSEDDTKNRGGDLGWFHNGKNDPDFDKAAFALKKGETSDVVKSAFGYHIIKLDDRRMVTATPTPTPQVPPGAPTPPPAPSPSPGAPQKVEEVKARHIYFSTQEAEGVETMLVQKKIKRAMEDATLQYPVQAPPDFTVTVGGLRKDAVPLDTGSGRIITPGEKK